MGQIHRRFSTDHVRNLLRGYTEGLLERPTIEETLAHVNVKDFSYPCGKDISQEHGKDISHPFGKQISHPPSE